jgi:hypothetical protein
MIWFACTQCGRVQNRPDEEAGTLIFCNCGASNRVPWESTGPEPAPQPVGRLESSEPAAAPEVDVSSPGSSATDAPPIPFVDDLPLKPTPRPALRQRDSAYCFNHQDLIQQQSCVDCRENFCADCVILFQGKVLCAPCKNFRIRKMHQPAALSLLALFSPILAITGGFVGFFMSAIAVQIGASAVGFASVLPQIAALGLGLAAMRRIENDPLLKGRPLAMTGIVAAVIGAIMSCLITLIMQRARE